MFFNLFRKDLSKINSLFLGHYVDPKVFYTVQFNQVPCINFIGELDTSKVFNFIRDAYRNELIGIYQHNYFDHEKRELFFNNSLLVLKNKRLIELGNNYCQILYPKGQFNWGQTMIKELSAFHLTGDTNKIIGFARTNHVN